MISDTLSDASFQIKRYLAIYEEDYREYKPRLDALLAEMDAIRALLDTPPDQTHAAP